MLFRLSSLRAFPKYKNPQNAAFKGVFTQLKYKAGIKSNYSYFYGNNSRRLYASYVYFDGKSTGPRFPFNAWYSSRYFTIGAAVLLFIGFTHIEKAPVTKRKRLMLCPQWLEKKVGQMSYKSIMAEYGNYVLPDNSLTSIKVKNVMKRLIYAAQHYHDPETGEEQNLFEDMHTRSIPVTDWKIHVIDDVAMRRETPNAFVIGDGKVFVFRSILPLCANDDGLATVLSHELGHQLAHHIGEKITKSPFYITLNLISYSMFGSNNLGSLIVSLGLERPSSREMETEADYIGLMVMSSACFNPQKAPGFWSRMIDFEKQNGGSVPEFISTHPSSTRRIRNLTSWMPKAEQQNEMAGCGNLFQRFNTMSFF